MSYIAVLYILECYAFDIDLVTGNAETSVLTKSNLLHCGVVGCKEDMFAI